MLYLASLALAVPFAPPQESTDAKAESTLDEGASTPSFEFRNGFWSNLHHFLYRDALEHRARRPLSIDEPEWSEAVAYYVERVIVRDLLFDEGMRAIDWTLSDAASAAELDPSGLDDEFAFVLASAAAPYRSEIWPGHRDANAQWIDSMRAPIAAHVPAIGARLRELFGEPWPAEAIRVDVLAYANWAPGYTSDSPNHIRIGTRYPRPLSPDEAFEILIHEASHIVMRTIESAITNAAERRGIEAPRDLWHVVLFFTVGEVVRESPATPNDYVPYAIANRVYDRRWKDQRRALEEHWGGYFNGTADLDTTLERVLGSLAQER